MEAPVLNAAKKQVATKELSEEIFGGDVNEALLWEVVRMQQACKRQGTHKAKTRAEVAGGGRKPFRQKGTGRARQGSSVSPVMTGGGIVFGPTPRDYSYSMPKKKKKAALRSALKSKLRDGELILVEDLGLTEVKTKALAATLAGLDAQNALIVIGEPNEIIEKSARNLPKVKVLRTEGLNVYDVLLFDKLVIVGNAIEKIEEGR